MKLSSFSYNNQQHLMVLLIALLSLVAFLAEQFFGENITNTITYQRELIIAGEKWRFLTGHFLHTNGYHLLLNLAALFMLLALHGRFYTIANYSALFCFCALFTSVGIYYTEPSLIQYVGLSGVLHGVFIFGAIMDIKAKDKTGYLLFIGVWLKIAHEQFYGASNSVSDLIEASVAVNAHLWGAIGGLIFTLLYLTIPHLKVTRTKKAL